MDPNAIIVTKQDEPIGVCVCPSASSAQLTFIVKLHEYAYVLEVT